MMMATAVAVAAPLVMVAMTQAIRAIRMAFAVRGIISAAITSAMPAILAEA
jgi:hypothetical protein